MTLEFAHWISPDTRSLVLGEVELESGEILREVRLAYRTWGRLAPGGDNAVLVCHALTGSADVDRWWPDLLGPGLALDPERDFVVCSNVLGGCYGSTGPSSYASSDGPFPDITVRDVVRAQAVLLDHLGIATLRMVIGGSLGGLQALEWAATFPERVRSLVPIASSTRHSPWCIALSEAQRRAIAADPEQPPRAGLAAARAIAMCSYRSPLGLGSRFDRRPDPATPSRFAVEAWLEHHGEAFVDRFDAASYVTLTRTMDSHDVGRGRGGVLEALRDFRGPALVVSVNSDVLYPPAEQEELAGSLPAAELVRLDSIHGHDGFLIEGPELNRIVRSFRDRVESGQAPLSQRPQHSPDGVARSSVAAANSSRRQILAAEPS
ncbi:MAG: homoserine O-acetyltransferase [Thermoanaerobaculia bacterium]|nr:homoserine O-acetyltransferase [Thermoanaerobaculia bacterium]